MRTILRKLLATLLALTVLAASATLLVQALEPYGNGLKIRNWVVNDPEYTFSEAYMSSVWYQNFHSLTLTKNQRNNVLRIAISQLGYHEGNSAKDFNGRNTAGNKNYIEYARLIVPNYNNNAYEWCACFVNWCLNQAHIDSCYGEIGCWKWVEWLKANQMFEDAQAYGGSYQPQPADMIFFNWNAVNTNSGHIGYVLYVSGDTVYTIEGNTSDQVGLRSYKLNDPRVIGYGTPSYEEGDEPTIDFSCKGGMPRGVYVISSASATLTSKPASTPRINKLALGSTVQLLDVEGSYAHVQVVSGETLTEGYVPTKYLFLMTPACTLTYMANGKTVAESILYEGNPLPTTPEVPAKEGYTGAWDTVITENPHKDVTIQAMYTPIEYRVTFEADGKVVSTETYNIENPSVTEPTVPPKDGYTGAWESYSLTVGDCTVKAIYEKIVETETESPTQATPEIPTEAPTTPPESATAAPLTENTEKPPHSEDTTDTSTSGGCHATASLATLLCLVFPAGALLRKKRRH